MRFFNYLNEAYKKALDIKEPETGAKYSDEQVSKIKKTIETGIKDAKKLKDGEAKDSIIADLEDKLSKWENVDKETEAPKPPPPADDKEDPEAAEDAEAKAEAEDEADEEEAAKKEEERAKEEEEKEDERIRREEEREKEREKREKEREKGRMKKESRLLNFITKEK